MASTDTAEESGDSCPPLASLPENTQAIFINEWALYLKELGRLAAAARCYELQIEMRMRQEKWKNASIGKRNLCDVGLLSGRLTGSAGKGSLSTAAEALRLAERADDSDERRKSHGYRAHARALRGEVAAALTDFHIVLDLQEKAFPAYAKYPLWGQPGISHTQLLARLGRRGEVVERAEANKVALSDFQGPSFSIPQCNLVLSDLPGESLDRSSRESLCRSARDWAVARDAKEVLCWSALVQARLELAQAMSFY